MEKIDQKSPKNVGKYVKIKQKFDKIYENNLKICIKITKKC